jgi:hypothetical protein
VDRLSLGHVFLPVLRVFPCHHHSTDASCCSIYHRHCVNLAIDSVIFFSLWRFDPIRGQGLPFWGFMITLKRTTDCRTPLDEWSARRRDLYLTIHNTHNGHTSTPPGGIGTRNPSKRATADPRLKPRGTGISHVSLHFTQKAIANWAAAQTELPVRCRGFLWSFLDTINP